MTQIPYKDKCRDHIISSSSCLLYFLSLLCSFLLHHGFSQDQVQPRLPCPNWVCTAGLLPERNCDCRSVKVNGNFSRLPGSGNCPLLLVKVLLRQPFAVEKGKTIALWKPPTKAVIGDCYTDSHWRLRFPSTAVRNPFSREPFLLLYADVVSWLPRSLFFAAVLWFPALTPAFCIHFLSAVLQPLRKKQFSSIASANRCLPGDHTCGDSASSLFSRSFHYKTLCKKNAHNNLPALTAPSLHPNSRRLPHRSSLLYFHVEFPRS